MDKRHTFYRKSVKIEDKEYQLVYVQRIPASASGFQDTHYGVFVSQGIYVSLEQVDTVINALIEARMALEVALSGERFGPECTCRAVPIPETAQVLISSEDDCPVHGFGEDSITMGEIDE